MGKVKIGFMGPQGSGKTTAAYELATLLKKEGLDVYILSEVARSSPLPLNEGATRESQLWIMGKQLTREQSAKGNVLISDRTLLDGFSYSMRVDPKFFESMKPFIKKYMKTYDTIFYKEPNDKYLISDGTRSINKNFRDDIDRIMKDLVMELDVEVIRTDNPYIYFMNNLYRKIKENNIC